MSLGQHRDEGYLETERPGEETSSVAYRGLWDGHGNEIVEATCDYCRRQYREYRRMTVTITRAGREVLLETIYGQRGRIDATEGRAEDVRPGGIKTFAEQNGQSGDPFVTQGSQG